MQLSEDDTYPSQPTTLYYSCKDGRLLYQLSSALPPDVHFAGATDYDMLNNTLWYAFGGVRVGVCSRAAHRGALWAQCCAYGPAHRECMPDGDSLRCWQSVPCGHLQARGAGSAGPRTQTPPKGA